jgi:histidyl-tRNA synthetase
MERLVSLLGETEKPSLEFYIVCQDTLAALKLAQDLRAYSHKAVEVDLSGKGFGKQLAHADKLGARFAVILGEDELASQSVTIKDLKAGEQSTMTLETFLSSFGA